MKKGLSCFVSISQLIDKSLFDLKSIEMKKFIICILVTIFSISLNAQGVLSKKITLIIENQNLEKIILKLEKENNIKFSYTSSIFDHSKKLNINLKEKPLSDVLKQILSPLNIKFDVIDDYIVLSSNLSNNEVSEKKKSINEQELKNGKANIEEINNNGRIAKGIVTNELGQPLVGVNIRLSSTNFVTTSDAKGNFSINLPSESGLVFLNYVGYKETQVRMKRDNFYTIKLVELSSSLSDVIVIAYGTQSKRQSSTAISTATGEDLLHSPTQNVTNSLTGRVSGLTTIQASGRPGDSQADIFIRGQVSSSATPLYIVDGIERTDFGDIDPNEIESISILKDAGSTAVFGIKGANGVVLVTTRQGKIGGTIVSYSSNLGLTTFSAIPKVLSSYPSAVLMDESQINVGINPRFSSADLENFKNGTGSKLLYPNTNWFKVITKPVGVQTQHNINVSGGNDKAKYFVSAGFLYSGGQMREYKSPNAYKVGTDFTRYNFRSNLDLRLTPTTNLSLRTAGRLEIRYSPIGLNSGGNNQDKWAHAWEGIMTRVYRAPTWLYPFFPEYTNSDDPAIQALDIKYNHIEDYSSYIINSYNPYAIETGSGYVQWNKDVVESIFSLDQNFSFITPGLRGKITLGFDEQFDAAAAQSGSYKAWGVDTATLQLVPSPTAPFSYDAPLLGIGVTRIGFNKTNLQMQLDYTRKIGTSQNISAVLVGQRELLRNTSSAPTANQGIIGRISYAYKRRYFLETSASYSGSENYASRHRYGLFPSFSAGWIISEERFFSKANKIVSFLKLRSSIGLVGIPSPSTGRFAYLSNYSYGGGTPSGGGGLSNPNSNVYFGTGNTLNTVVYQNSFGNSDVSWETSRKRNIGLDATLFNNKLNGTIDIFDDLRYNILSTRSNSAFTVYGTTQPPTNFGKNYNRGFEISLHYANNWKNKFTYGINFNYSYAHNEILVTDDAPGAPANLKKSGTRIGQYFGYQVVGFYKDKMDIANSAINQTTSAASIPGDLKYKDLTGSGTITSNDMMPIGYSRLPEIIYSIEPTARFKRISISIMFQAATHVSSDVKFTDNFYENMLGRWTPSNPDHATWPVLRPPYGANPNYDVTNTFVLQDGSYIKLRNIQINYEIPFSIAKKLGLKSCRVYVNGQNLKTWTKFLYLDPENYSKLPSGDYGAANHAAYPGTRIFNFGVNVQL